MDLADQIDDYICSFEGIGDLTMDSLAMFIFIWAVLALFLVWLCKFLYNKYFQNSNKPTSNSNSRQSSVAPGIRTEKRLSEPRDILASKSDIKELLSKPQGGKSSGNAPAIRRRVVRQSSTGPENRKKRYIPPPSNVVGPESTSVTWTSHVFRWLYSDLVIVNELLMTWVIALNDTLRKSADEHGAIVEIIRVLPDSPPPGLSNIFCNSDEVNPADMIVSFDCDAMPVFQVKTSRQKSGKVEISHYKVTVSRLRSRMACTMNYNALRGEMRIEGYPDIRINMNSVGAIKPMDQEEQAFQNLLSDILGNALRETIYPVDFSMYATCPRAEGEPTNLPTELEQQSQQISSNQSTISGRRLLVKIVKGEGLQNARDPFVVVEMDEPAQKNQTGTKQGANPLWDEHFLFELSPKSAEILFEVYDRLSPTSGQSQDKFLGLGLVGIDELSVGLASTQTLNLQPRPYETQEVHGAITVDFVFIEGAEIPINNRAVNIKEALRLNTPVINDHLKNGADLADAAVRALQDRSTSSSNINPSKSTLIIHSVQRVELNNAGQIEVMPMEQNHQQHDNAAVNNTSFESHNLDSSINQDSFSLTNPISDNLDITDSSYMTDELQNTTGNASSLQEDFNNEFGKPNAASSPNGFHNNYDLHNVNGNVGHSAQNNYNSLPRNGNNLVSNEGDLDDRGRSKKRTFFGTLKKRLSRSKTRTHSADINKNNANTQVQSLNGDSRSLSVDRAISNSNSVGNRIGVNSTLNHSRRSSISESSAISGFSSASNKTYVHEASTLVLETLENGIKRHFIVPLAIAQRPRWRRKGTKLHIYNDHTFVAKHLSGSGLQCSICMKSIPRRPGKQGYECRDCNIICHKQCHVRAPQACPNPTILSMELTKLNSQIADRSIRKV